MLLRRLLSVLTPILVATAAAGLPAASAATTKLVHAGTLLAVPGQPPERERTLVIVDERISEVRKGYADPADFEGEVEVVDLKDFFVLPGLMDMHVHLQGELGPENDSEALRLSPQQLQMRSVMYAMRTLEAGFTTLRDVGSSEQEMYALRDGIESGWIEGPRIIAAGGVGITGGHADVSGMKPELMAFYTDASICDGPYDCRRATRDAIKYGADLIKITSTGGVLTDRATGTGQQMEMDELREVVRAANRMGRKVASHAHAAEGIIAALEAGVDSIEHGTYVNDEAIALFRETGAYLVPTLLAGATVKQMAEESDFMRPAIREKAIRVGREMKNNFGKAHRAGVKVAFGTDSGVSKHGHNAQEAVLMVEAGMSAEDVIVAATVNAADLIDMTDDLGTLEKGKYADVIAVDGSPLDDIAELLDVDFVMKGGKVFKTP
ncbi:metal-dependent hydrolase family protein [Lentisalinibacter salinarum]|uniref:metal-dependent hydrolase family protein n=1 Tax=Lentisalinibacter salinarum TaxID=2992239 RepID=UPI00386D1A92